MQTLTLIAALNPTAWEIFSEIKVTSPSIWEKISENEDVNEEVVWIIMSRWGLFFFMGLWFHSFPYRTER